MTYLGRETTRCKKNFIYLMPVPNSIGRPRMTGDVSKEHRTLTEKVHRGQIWDTLGTKRKNSNRL